MAYTPWLKMKAATVVRKERRLPVHGEILVRLGDEVSSDQIVAKTHVAGDPESVNLALALGLEEPKEIVEFVTKKEGESVEENEIIAMRKVLFGLSKIICRSPVRGTVELISDVTGMVFIRKPPVPVEMRAYIAGKVVEVLPEEGVIIETLATYVQGVLGIGGETNGEVAMISNSPSDVTGAGQIGPECAGKILVCGAVIKLDGIRRAVEMGVKGVIVGGVPYEDLVKFMGRDLGVAITGQEELGLTLILTEGFGEMTMSDKAFTLLKSCAGRQASINGATQIRAGVIRPEIIVPFDGENEPSLETALPSAVGLQLGAIVRIIHDPYFGSLGKVTALPTELQLVQTESRVRVLQVELEDGRNVIVPRANVEIIEA